MKDSIVKEGKTLAIISYLTFIGMILAIIMNLEKRNPFTAFHIRQMLGLMILLIFSNLVEQYVNSLLGTAFWIVTFACWLFGLYYAIKEEYKLIPVLGEKFQEWFKTIN
ncbi:DUF4870 domain-containing protein [Gelidibacter maritimus]|uniref:Chloroplast import component protein (Tic20) n=1 Tax=Gelidibacter maritimus TaxID=2761487 RepID=A0A7W2M6K8_9FLAO|nr:hypothetical protein [Gelidibacter maritimus]MBA6153618.1 hypothetical protein [Gelidibacter maritimus]